MVGIAALRLGRPATAGFTLGYAALLRVFPAVAIVGFALKVFAQVVSERSLAPLRRHVRFAAGMGAAGLLFLVGSSVMVGRAAIWEEFVNNSRKHLATESANLVGLQVLLAYDHSTRLEVMTDPLALDRYAAWKERLGESERRTRPSRSAVR